MSRFKINLNITEILQRVGQSIGSDKNTDIADALNVNPQVCTNWKTRGTIPWPELFQFSQDKAVSLEWLLTGKKLVTEDELNMVNAFRELNPEKRSALLLYIMTEFNKARYESKKKEEEGVFKKAVNSITKAVSNM